MGKGAGEGKEADHLQGGFCFLTQPTARFTRGQSGHKAVLPGVEVRETPPGPGPFMPPSLEGLFPKAGRKMSLMHTEEAACLAQALIALSLLPWTNSRV